MGALLGAAVTMLLMERYGDWFSMWFWPIGFGLTMVIGLLLSFVWQTKRDRQQTPLTYREVMRHSAEHAPATGVDDEVP